MTGALLALLAVSPGGLRLPDLLTPGAGPAAVHYRARYRTDDGAWHALEVWRDRLRLRRRTDDRLEVHAHRAAPGTAPSLVVLDLPRGTAYAATPDELLQAGLLTDWNELAHSIARLRPGDRLAPRPRNERTALGPCRVYALVQAKRRSSICWSSHWQLPLLIRDRSGRPVFELQSAEDHPLDARVFELAPRFQAQLGEHAD